MKRFAAMAALSGLLLIVPLSEGHAACERGKRVSDPLARCMKSETWRTSGFFNKKDHAKVRNECPEWGKVVAKVDIRDGTDSTWTLTDGNWKHGSWRPPSRVRRVSCCSDLSDLCSKSDVLKPQGCEAQFDKSPAAKTCYDKTFEINGENCVINAQCKQINKALVRTSINAHYLKTKTLNNCNGKLTLGSC